MPDFIKVVLDRIESSGIDYCILRNYEDLPFSYPSGDIDILVEFTPGRFRTIEKLVRDAAKLHGWTMHCRTRHSFVSLNLYLSKASEYDVTTINFEFRTTVLIYFPSRYRLLGHCYIDTSSAVKSSIRHNGLKVIGNELELVQLLCEIIFNEKDKYWDRVFSLHEIISKPVELRCLIRRTFGEKIAGDVLDNLSNKNTDYFCLKREIIGTAFREANPVSLCWQLMRDINSLMQHIYQYIVPSGKLCVLLGPDGSGKTFLADCFAKKHSRAFAAVRRIHLGNRPILLRSFLGGKSTLGPENQVLEPQQDKFHSGVHQASYNRVYNTARYVYHVLDYVAHYWFVLRRYLANGELIISERYIYDYIVAPDRYICGVPLTLKRALTALVPRPDIVIFIKVNPHVLLSRKRELPLQQVQVEQASYEKMSKNYDWNVVDNTDHPELSLKEIPRVVFGRMTV